MMASLVRSRRGGRCEGAKEGDDDDVEDEDG